MRYTFCLALLLLVFSAFNTPKLIKTQITKQITVSIPQGFVTMPDEAIAQKYPAQRKPLAVFTSPNGQVDLAVSQRPASFSKKDLAMAKQFYKASILSMYSDVEFAREELTTINNQEFIVFEFVSTVKDDRSSSTLAPVKRYTIVQYTILDKALTIFTFNVPFNQKREWQQTAQQVMASVKAKD